MGTHTHTHARTHAHTHTHTIRRPRRNSFKNQGVPGLKITLNAK